MSDVVPGVLERPLTEHRDPQAEPVLLARRLLFDVPGDHQGAQQAVRRARGEADGAGDLGQTQRPLRAPTHSSSATARSIDWVPDQGAGGPPDRGGLIGRHDGRVLHPNALTNC